LINHLKAWDAEKLVVRASEDEIVLHEASSASEFCSASSNEPGNRLEEQETDETVEESTNVKIAWI